MRRKIGTKIIGGYVLFVVLVLSLLGASYRLMTTTIGHAQDMYEGTDELRLEMEAENILWKQVSALSNYLLLEDKEYLREFNQQKTEFLKRIETLKPFVAGKHPDEEKMLAHLERQYDIFLSGANKAVVLSQAGNLVESLRIEGEEVDPSEHEVERALKTLIATEKAEMEESVEHVRSVKRYAGVFPFVSTTIANAATIHTESLALQRELEAESIAWKQEIAKTDLFLFNNTEYITEFYELEKVYQEIVARKKGFASGDKERALVNDIRNKHQLLVDGFGRVARFYEAGDKVAALRLEKEEIGPLENDLGKSRVEFHQLNQGNLNSSLEDVRLADAMALSMIKTFGFYVLILLVIGLFAGTIIALRISRPISELAKATQRLTSGDFGARAKVSSRDEVGVLAASFNKMAESLLETTVSKDDLKAIVDKRTAELAQVNDALQADVIRRKRAEAALRHARDGMEAKVTERTAELACANEALQSDIVERQRSEMERQVVAEIVQSAITTADLNALFKLAQNAINKVLPAENCFIALHNPATDVMHCEYWVDQNDPAPSPRPLGKGFSSYMLRTGRPLLLTKEFKEEMYGRGEVLKSGTDSLSWVGVPLRTGSRTSGVLVVQHYEEENAYSQRDLQFLATVGDQLGLAIERKQIELKLKANEAQLTEAQHVARLGSWEWDVLTNTVSWSDELYRIVGLEPQEFGATYKAYLATIHPEDRELVESTIEEALQNRAFPEFEHRIVHTDGSIVDVQANGTVHVDDSGSVIKISGTALDITQRKMAEKALQEADRRAITEYERLLNRLASLAQSLGSARDLTSIYRSLSAFTLASAPCSGIVIAIYHPVEQAREAVYVWNEGQEMPLGGCPSLPVGDGPIGKAIKSGEVQVYEDLEKEVLNRPVVRLGSEGHIVRRPAVIAPMAIMGRVIGILEIQNGGGEPYKVEHVTALRMAANLAAGAIQNVRLLELERKKEERLQQAQKMESIGTLAGGIAHDFNNILAAILGYSELAAGDLPSDHVAQSHLNQVLQAANRARESVKQILTFSRQQEPHRKVVDIGPVLVEALSLLRASLPASIEIVTQVDSDLPPLLGDAGRIHQVMMNLATNAMHAMSESGGVLEVKLATLEMDADSILTHADLREGPYLHLTVSDSGCGIEGQTLERIFEPFFTTKGPGEGTGLGLATVYGIVKEHDGAISVYSQPGEGTTFHIYFPVHEALVADVALSAPAIPQGSGQHVMFVDDEAPLALLGKQRLERLGYQVTTHTNSVEALKAFHASPARFDLVITDYTMPHLNGADLAIDMLKVRPEMPVIMLTGYASTMNVERTASIGIRELLLKPTTAQTIGQAVNRALNQKKEA